MELTDEIISKLQVGDPQTEIRLRMYIVELLLKSPTHNPIEGWENSDAKRIIEYIKDGHKSK
jgi:hypothetical protein